MNNAHPLDPRLSALGLVRLSMDDLTAERRPAVLLSRPIGFPSFMAVEIFLWRQGEKAHAALAGLAPGAQPPAILAQMVQAGRAGMSPISGGLSPCNCPPIADGQPRWNPLCVPILWREGVTQLVPQAIRYYSELLAQPDWQCLDMRHLVQR